MSQSRFERSMELFDASQLAHQRMEIGERMVALYARRHVENPSEFGWRILCEAVDELKVLERVWEQACAAQHAFHKERAA